MYIIMQGYTEKTRCYFIVDAIKNTRTPYHNKLSDLFSPIDIDTAYPPDLSNITKLGVIPDLSYDLFVKIYPEHAI